MNLTLRQLRYFEALAAQRHFGRAAEVAAVSQPALSMQIRELEKSLGAALFERASTGARLTRFGAELAPRVRAVLQAVDELGEAARAAQDRLTGELRLGIIPTVAPYLLPGLIGALGRSHPELELHVRETLTPRLVDELLAGRIDAAIVALPVGAPGLEEEPLFSERFALVRQVSEADAPVPGPEALREARLLLLEEGHCFRDQALAFCDLPTAGPRDGLDGSSLSTLVQMVGAGLGMTLIPDMAIAVETRRANVAVARFAPPEPSRTLGLVWRRSSPLGPRFREIAEVVRPALSTAALGDPRAGENRRPRGRIVAGAAPEPDHL